MRYMSFCTREPRAPFPYFGGKRNAAQIVWDAFGDVGHYVEPFCGSCAMLLSRPKMHTRRCETVNDADGMICNVWRALRDKPDETAAICADPVMEIELHARIAYVKERMTRDFVAWLEGNPDHCDAKIAAYWIYATCASIGECWADDGPWRVVDGKLVNTRKLPHIGGMGRGINRELPHIGDMGHGINRKLPHIGDMGRGINRKLPHIGDMGHGINRELPHIGGMGRGINRKERIRQYFRALAQRLESVRICCGDWRRIVNTPITIFADQSTAGIFLDPPYTIGTELYAEAQNVSGEVREWCKTAPKAARIALCGFDVDGHNELCSLGWTCVQGAAGGPGYNTDKTACKRERIWLSPSCIGASQDLFSFAQSQSPNGTQH